MNSWQPIETAPRDGTSFLLYLKSEVGHGPIVIANYRDTKLWGPCWDFEDGYTVCLKDNPADYWMPLPERPL